MSKIKAKIGSKSASSEVAAKASSKPSPTRRLTAAQRSWLERGLDQAGGKLPLFDVGGREISHRTIRACIAAGLAEPWFSNPIKPDWLVCRLTEEGYRALGKAPPGDL
ncbi:hypothetical protein GR183_02125 [Stappia sp. GBMRC 2046]|uniref:Uncharacterized protein n=1 Tax=Stappia sediminis TaxID=2692190 RepID=A0A7X3S656_9HYPH|nr:hypothetical protein [Stappia sediminis]MXN63688.1 hypothetical protein [Stappia sediminis]